MAEFTGCVTDAMWGEGEGGTEGDLSGQGLPWSKFPPGRVQSDGELAPSRHADCDMPERGGGWCRRPMEV